MLEDLIPLLQTLVWPMVLIGFFIRFRGPVNQILNAISERIKSGAPIEAGPGGIKIGPVQAPPSTEKILAAAEDTRAVDELPHPIYLTHQAVRDHSLDRGGQQYYRLQIALDADKPEMLDEVEKVTYHLHPTFRNPDRTSIDRETNFAIGTAAWGEFNMTAEIFFQGGIHKLVVERYINFPSA